MENQKVSPWKGNLNWGLILGFVLIIYTAILYFMDQMGNQSLGWISFAIMIVVTFFGIKAYRDTFLGGFMTYGQALGSGVLINFYASIVGGIFTILLYGVIDPDLTQKLIVASQDKLLEQGMAEAQVEQAMSITKIFLKPVSMGIIGVFISTIFGLLISLILGIFLKKEGRPAAPVSQAESAE